MRRLELAKSAGTPLQASEVELYQRLAALSHQLRQPGQYFAQAAELATRGRLHTDRRIARAAGAAGGMQLDALASQRVFEVRKWN